VLGIKLQHIRFRCWWFRISIKKGGWFWSYKFNYLFTSCMKISQNFLYSVMSSSNPHVELQITVFKSGRFITFLYTAVHAYCAPECANFVSAFILS